MFFVEITNGLITAKGEGPYKTNEQIEITEEVYNALINLPAEYEEVEGKIINVSPLPSPEPEITATERREKEYETNPLIEWQGKNITVDQANMIYLQYLAENSARADEIQGLIIIAKSMIREMYPGDLD